MLLPFTSSFIFIYESKSVKIAVAIEGEEFTKFLISLFVISEDFKILDSNNYYQRINFIDLIEKNISIPIPIDDDIEETEEDISDFEYY